MVKQFYYYEYAPYCMKFVPYHDGMEVKSLTVSCNYVDNMIEKLNGFGYTFGYPEDAISK